MNKLLDLYTDYLQVTFGQASATGLSSLLDSAVSHDKFTRLLSTNEFSSRDLWLSVKALAREHQTADGCLIFDDVIVHKPHTDESELVNWHFDHTENRAVKGINVLTAFYHSQLPDQELPLRVPVLFEAVKKEFHFCDLKTRKEKRRGKITKNEMLRQMVEQTIKNQLPFSLCLSRLVVCIGRKYAVYRAAEEVFHFRFEIESFGGNHSGQEKQRSICQH